SIEEEPLGTAGPISLINDIDDTFLVMNGDILTTLDYKKLIEYHKKEGAIATVAMQRRNVKIDFGVITSLADNRMVKYIEKPEHFYNVSMGIYVFEPRVKDYIEHARKLDFPELINKLLKAEEKVMVYPSDDFWLDIGRWEDFERAVEEFQTNRKRFLPDE
ncbi:nucleotidyltransferase family protein, partial [bacterium]|nr:nucleotidyltransferase family protein [bacterium]